MKFLFIDHFGMLSNNKFSLNLEEKSNFNKICSISLVDDRPRGIVIIIIRIRENLVFSGGKEKTKNIRTPLPWNGSRSSWKKKYQFLLRINYE